jgi:hypothetical protein
MKRCIILFIGIIMAAFTFKAKSPDVYSKIPVLISVSDCNQANNITPLNYQDNFKGKSLENILGVENIEKILVCKSWQQEKEEEVDSALITEFRVRILKSSCVGRENNTHWSRIGSLAEAYIILKNGNIIKVNIENTCLIVDGILFQYDGKA